MANGKRQPSLEDLEKGARELEIMAYGEEYIVLNDAITLRSLLIEEGFRDEELEERFREQLRTCEDFPEWIKGMSIEDIYKRIGNINLSGSNIHSQFKRNQTYFKLKHMTKADVYTLLIKANRRRKSAERTVRKMRGTIRQINDDAMKSISSRQRAIEEQWEVMRELQRRGLVSTEDLEAVLKDVMHVVRIRF